MNMRTFNKLVNEGTARLNRSEWLIFTQVCEIYLKSHKIKNPVIVEIGMEERSQAEFYKQIFGADYSGVNQPKDMKWLKEKLDGKIIDILSISGGGYKEVKANFDVYSPLCGGIITIHDIESCRYKKRQAAESWKLWDELKLKTIRGAEKYENFLFLSIYKKRIRGNQRGIGVIIKRWI